MTTQDFIADFYQWFLSPSLHLQVQGLSGPARAYFLARLIKETSLPPILLIEPSWQEAETLYQDVLFFSEQASVQEYPHAVILYESEETLPYEQTGYDARATQARMRTLFQLTQQRKDTRLVITSATQLVRQTIPQKILQRHSDLILRHQNIDRDRLIATLQAGGYTHVPTCEDPGTYSVRGGILDIFCPLYEQPVRVELFGDQVEFLRTYNKDTQRTEKTIDEYYIHPVREVVLDAETVEHAQQALMALADEVNCPNKKIKIIKEELENRINFFGIEAYLPAFYNHFETLLDYYIDYPCIVIWDNQDAIKEAITEQQARAQKEYQDRQEQHKLHFEPARHFKDIFNVPLRIERQVFLNQLIDNASQSQNDPLSLSIQDLSVLRAQLSTFRALPNFNDHLKPLIDCIQEGRIKKRLHVLVLSQMLQAERIKNALFNAGYKCHLEKEKLSLDRLSKIEDQRHQIFITFGTLTHGFELLEENIIFITESDIFGDKIHVNKNKPKKTSDFVSDLKELQISDLVVHADFGIGRYLGLKRLNVRGIEEDYLHIEYAGADKLFLPIFRIGLIQRYSENNPQAKLDKLGNASVWEAKKQRVKDAVLAIAHDLLQLYAQRQVVKVTPLPPPNDLYQRFEEAFCFEETADQRKAIDDILGDLKRDFPMDRLLCGDVGFGKTEVAMRAAFYVASQGLQVCVLVPTTVLAEQHYRTFCERMSTHEALRIEVLSRFKDKEAQKQVIQRLKTGHVDIIIGTHRLLSLDVEFKKLGLVVIDEEQRFGVKHKERLRKMRHEVHVLTMTATPIPRTLHMSMLGIRDLSLITTPPVDRLATRTQVTQFEEEVIKESIDREIKRGGQVYFVHNRVQSIFSMADYLKRIVPDIKIAVAHGQMAPEKLEEQMVRFIQKECQVLLCTTIIESGIDIPSANTMIVNRADTFGLAQLYQLRGRIGRSKDRAYAILLIPKGEKITEEARQRLEALKRFSDLGAGFKIASHDMDIRGAGNLIGPDQSGHIAAVGFELYSELVSQAVAELKGSAHTYKKEPEIRLPLVALIPEKYVADTSLRLNYYKRLAQSDTETSTYDVLQELNDFYGPLPDSVVQLGALMRLKIKLILLGIISLDGVLNPNQQGAKISMQFDAQASIDRVALVHFVAQKNTTLKLTQEGKLVCIFDKTQVNDNDSLITHIDLLLESLKDAITKSAEK